MSDGVDRILERLARGENFKERCAKAQSTLTSAEAAAATTNASRVYQIAFRLTKRDTAVGVGYDKRRDALVAMIEALKPLERHVSTSTFRVRVHLAAAADLRDCLRVPLDAGLDFLDVVEITANEASFGNVKVG